MEVEAETEEGEAPITRALVRARRAGPPLPAPAPTPVFGETEDGICILAVAVTFRLVSGGGISAILPWRASLSLCIRIGGGGGG